MKNINKKLSKLTLASLIVSSSLLANDTFVNSLGVNLGVSNTNYSQTNNQGSIILGNEPDKSFNSIEVFTTLNPILELCKTYNMKPYLSYTYSTNTDLKHQYVLTGVNKYYNHDTIQYYAGVLVGFGELKWKYNPLNGTNNNDHKATSFMIGLQTGLEYPITSKYSFNLNAKYLAHDYETKLSSSSVSATIDHQYTASVGVGVSYRF